MPEVKSNRSETKTGGIAQPTSTLGGTATYDLFLANAAVRHFQPRLAGISKKNYGLAPGAWLDWSVSVSENLARGLHTDENGNSRKISGIITAARPPS